MGERHETVIVGDDHASLAMSHHLSRRGRPHVVLERGRLAERWDSLRFQVPNASPCPVSPVVMQLHSSAYRNPRQLPRGAVLVVGSGASGSWRVPVTTRRRSGRSTARHRSALAPIRTIDLAELEVAGVIWATRFRRDFGWIDLPMLDDRGEPIHRRGVTDWPGLYFLALPCLHTL